MKKTIYYLVILAFFLTGNFYANNSISCIYSNEVSNHNTVSNKLNFELNSSKNSLNTDTKVDSKIVILNKKSDIKNSNSKVLLPSATISGGTTACLNATSPVITFTGSAGTSPYTFRYNINGGALQTISTAPGNNTVTVNAPTTVLGTFNYNLVSVQDSSGLQLSPMTTIVRVVASPILVPSPTSGIYNYTICEDDPYPSYSNDGVASFFLHTQDLLISGNAAMTVYYYETLTDAQNAFPGAEISMANASPYRNTLFPTNHTLFVRVFDPAAPNCATIAQLKLKVNPIPVPTLNIPDFVKCDSTLPNLNNGTESFNLHDWDLICGMVAGTTARYYFSQGDAMIGGNTAVMGLLPYTYDNISSPQTIWVRIQNNTTGCFGIRSFRLIVNPVPVVPKPIQPEYTLCETTVPGDYKEIFNLSTQNANVTTVAGISINYYLSQALAIAGAAGTDLPNLYTNQSPVATPGVQTIWVRVTNTTTGCFDVSTLTLRVNQLPVPVMPVGAIKKCDQDQDGRTQFDLTIIAANISNGSGDRVTFYETENDAINETGSLVNTLTSPYTNLNVFTQFLWVRMQNLLTGCYKVIRIELNVIPAPLAPTTGMLHDLTDCDDNDANHNDGFTAFDLTEVAAGALSNAQILINSQVTGAPSYTLSSITYHTTQLDASTGLNPIATPTNYTNQSNPETIWISIRNNSTSPNYCRNWGSFQLKVDLPLVLVQPAPLVLCDDGPITSPPTRPFDLTVLNNPILTNMPAGATGYTVDYYPSQANSLANVNRITTPANYTNIANPQTLGVKVTTPDSCVSYTTVTVRVLPNPTPRTTGLPNILRQCETDPVLHTAVFNITVNETYIRNGDNTLVVKYYPTVVDAIAVPATNEITAPTTYTSAAGSIIIKVMNAQMDSNGERCFVLVTQPILVDQLPTVVSNTLYAECEANSDGFFPFNLNSQNGTVLGTQSPTAYTVTYHLSPAAAAAGTGALASPYTNTVMFNTATPPVTQQTLYIRVRNNTTNCVNSTGIINLLLEEGAVANPITVPLPKVCDTDGLNDGMHIFDLTPLVAQVLGTQTQPTYSVEFFDSLVNLNLGNAISPITGYMTTTPTSQPIWIKVTNTTNVKNPKCFAITTTTLEVEKLSDPIITSTNNSNTLCVDFNTGLLVPGSEITLDSGIPVGSLANFTYQWHYDDESGTGSQPITGATSQTYQITTDKPGKYSVVVTSLMGCLCNPSTVYTIYKSGPPVLLNPNYTVTNAFSQNQVITVNYQGHGEYQFSLNDGPYQDSEIFEQVPMGTHIIKIRTKPNPLHLNTCQGNEIKNVQVIDFPHFFTPNGDGQNDIWSLGGLANQPNAKVYIFDRYGKLLKQIGTCAGCGWDGNILGKPLDASDYWFTIEYEEQGISKTFKSHFTLKR